MSPKLPIIVALSANDLPEAPSTTRARLRERERRLKGPNWSAPPRELETA
ncbi:MAG TPA: hypothetical protein VGD87_06735 [Archangium sp.]